MDCFLPSALAYKRIAAVRAQDWLSSRPQDSKSSCCNTITQWVADCIIYLTWSSLRGCNCVHLPRACMASLSLGPCRRFSFSVWFVSSLRLVLRVALLVFVEFLHPEKREDRGTKCVGGSGCHRCVRWYVRPRAQSVVQVPALRLRCLRTLRIDEWVAREERRRLLLLMLLRRRIRVASHPRVRARWVQTRRCWASEPWRRRRRAHWLLLL